MRDDVIELIQWLIVDVDYGTKLLKIPTNIFMNEDLEEMYQTIVAFKKQYGVVSHRELGELAKRNKFNWQLFVEGRFYEYLENKDFGNHLVKSWVDLYQNKVLEKFKEIKTNKLQQKYMSGKIDRFELGNELDKINSYQINTNENFETIHELDLSDEERIYIKSGTNQIDNEIKGFALGELSVWSGSNGSAKSTYLNQIALESINQNYKVAIYSGELTSKRLMQWMVLQASRKEDVRNIKGFYKPTESARDKILYWLDDKLFVFNNTKGSKKELILQSVRDVVEHKKVQVVIIDNLMSIELEKNNKYDEQSDLVKELSVIAKELNIHIHFVCHPRKAIQFLRKNDISGTADLTNIADNVFILHRVGKDFVRNFKETFGIKDDEYPLFKYSNVIEICKNREFGVQDRFIGLYYEVETKRLLNSEGEKKYYGWENMR